MQVHTRTTLITPWYRQRWPWLLMAGPFIVALAACYSYWLAVSHPDALVEGDYYSRGKAINIDLHRDRVAAQLGLQADVTYDAASGQLSGRLLGPGDAIGKIVHLRLVHATLPAQDVDLQITPDAQGYFSAELALLGRARWQVILDSDQGGWRLAGVWPWPEQTRIVLTAESGNPH